MTKLRKAGFATGRDEGAPHALSLNETRHTSGQRHTSERAEKRAAA